MPSRGEERFSQILESLHATARTALALRELLREKGIVSDEEFGAKLAEIGARLAAAGAEIDTMRRMLGEEDR